MNNTTWWVTQFLMLNCISKHRLCYFQGIKAHIFRIPSMDPTVLILYFPMIALLDYWTRSLRCVILLNCRVRRDLNHLLPRQSCKQFHIKAWHFYNLRKWLPKKYTSIHSFLFRDKDAVEMLEWIGENTNPWHNCILSNEYNDHFNGFLCDKLKIWV